MRRINPTVMALGAVVLLLLIVWLFSTNRSADQDKLVGDLTSAAQEDPEKRCASKATYDLIKRELFRRAAQVRGSDQSAFDRLSAYAALRVENPVMETEEAASGLVNCSASLSLDLPPGVAAVGGRRTLAADVDYSVQPAADGSGPVVLLRNADAIVTPLATLARIAQPAAPSSGAEPPAPADPLAPAPPPVADEPAPAEPTPPDRIQAQPSFNCGAARTRGEIAVCRDSGLASLDRQMAAQFVSAMSRADGEERALLQRTRSRFLSYRDSCRSDACIADAYRGRMREISDIMAGRWQPPR